MRWPVRPIGEVFEVARGGSPRPIQNFLTEEEDGLNWIMIGDASEGSKYITTTKKRIKPEGLKKTRVVHDGDFLLTNSMSFGHPYILKTSGCIHDGWLVLSPREENISRDFFYYLLGSDALYREFSKRAAGAVVKNLNTDIVKRVEIPLPPLTEQKRIAAILDAADALRAKRREALAQLDTLIHSTFLDMFGDPIANPKGWKVSSIEEIGYVRGGLQVTSKRRSLPVERPYLRVANVFRGFLDLDEIKTIRLTQSELLRTSLLDDDILIVEGHGNPDEIGRCARWDGSIEHCVHQNHLIRLRCDRSKAVPIYTENYMNSAGGRMSLLGTSRTTSGLNTISVSKVRASKIHLPPLDLQHRFADIVKSIEQQKANQRAHLDELDNLFASLQSRAFRGDL